MCGSILCAESVEKKERVESDGAPAGETGAERITNGAAHDSVVLALRARQNVPPPRNHYNPKSLPDTSF